MTARAIKGAEASQLPRIHYFGEVSSTFDEAMRLFQEGRLAVWDSVIAKSQTGGRGQMRRHWISPPGNLYWTVRLPLTMPFDTSAGPVAIGALLTSALCDFGCQALLKWPNDVVLRAKKGIAKVAGILLEEKGGCLLAGIGINIANAPDAGELAESDGMPATSLAACVPAGSLPPPSQLAQQLLRHIYSASRDAGVFANVWRELAAKRLLWLGERVRIQEGDEQHEGLFLGLGPEGSAQLEKDGNARDFFGGTMRPL